MPITEAGRWSLRFAQNIRRKKDNEDFQEQVDNLIKECAESSVEHRTEVPMTGERSADCFLFADESRLAYFAVGTEDYPRPLGYHLHDHPSGSGPCGGRACRGC